MARKSIAPWSERVAEGLIDQPFSSSIITSETLRPTVDTGFIDQQGTWKGNVSSDTEFKFYQRDSAIANGATFITHLGFDMTGFQDVTLAIKPTNSGNYAITACMGSDGTNPYANLTPLNDATAIRGSFESQGSASSNMANLFSDNSESLTADVWNIFIIQSRLRNTKLLQFKITNNTGDISTVETYFLRSV